MHEPLWYAVRKGAKSNWQGDRTQTTLWEISHTKSETGHSTQKPLDCMRRPIVNNSTPGEAVYDPFLGSGTTVIAAELERRRCYGLEIDPAYVDVIVERWQNYTGKIATLEDGTPFEAVRAQRRAGQAIPEASIPPTSGPPAEPVETAMPFEPIPAEAMP
jgi:DNA modification methylase